MAHSLRPIPLDVLVPSPRLAALARRLRRPAPNAAPDDEALPPAAKRYLTAVVLAALGAALALFGLAATPTPGQVALAPVLAGAMTLGWLFPLPFLAGTKLHLDTAALVAAVLLLDPALVVPAAAASTLLAQALRRQPWDQVLFNVAQAALLAAAGGGLLAAAGWRAEGLGLDRPVAALLPAAVGVLLCLLNLLNVATMVALFTGQRVPATWLGALRGIAPAEAAAHLAQVAAGVLAAAAVGVAAWALAPVLAAGAAYQLATQLRRRRVPTRPVAATAAD